MCLPDEWLVRLVDRHLSGCHKSPPAQRSVIQQKQRLQQAHWCKIFGMKNLMLILPIIMTLAACGLKGDLYLPDDEQVGAAQAERSSADAMQPDDAADAEEEADGARP